MACTSSEFSSMACLSSLIPQTGISYQKFKFFPMSSNVTKLMNLAQTLAQFG